MGLDNSRVPVQGVHQDTFSNFKAIFQAKILSKFAKNAFTI